MLYYLIFSTLIFIPSIVAAVKGHKKEALWLLLLAAAAVRLMMIGLDPFLHDWDERFHAVVAKNMMQYPFKPMLRLEALLPYKAEDWCCNYIWVHKQPLFLWQMALSMKIFGVNTIALRLPNVIMETFAVFCIYRIAQIWTRNTTTAWLAALLYAASYYSLELCSGRMSLDHNDVMMGGYVTASIWAFCEYTGKKNWKWAILAGVFAGCAVLVKWLTGLLIFGGWGVYLLVSRALRKKTISWLHLAGSAGICFLVFMPWQIYIRRAFPVESAISYAYNYKHIFENLGHPGNVWTHLDFMTTAYSNGALVFFLAMGILLSFRKSIDRKLSLSMISMFVVVYAFFSIIVATKMPGLTYPVAAIGFIEIAIGIEYLLSKCSGIIARVPVPAYTILASGLAFGIVLGSCEPDRMAAYRNPDSTERNIKLHNTAIYKELNRYVSPDEVILNCKSFEDTEVRFWQPNNAYHWYPTASEIDSLLKRGYKLAAFKSHHDQILPEYITRNPQIKILNLEIQ